MFTAAEDAPFLSGLRVSGAEELAWARENAIERLASTKDAGELPAAVKNVEFLPVVGRQALPNCGAFAPTYYMKTYQEARKRGWGRPSMPDRIMSPGIAYALGQADVDGGSILGTIMIMGELGILPLSRLPDSYGFDRSIYPPARLLLEAMPYRGGQPVFFNPKTEDGFLAIKEWLADGELVVFGMGISLNTSEYGRSPIPDVDNDVIFGRGGSFKDLHAFTLIGYDDTRTYHDGSEEKQGAFYAVNSWGTGWGVEDPDIGTGGFMWIGYDYFRDAVFEGVWSMTEREHSEPEWVGLFEYEHPYSVQVQISFHGGDIESPDWESRWIGLNPSEHTAYTRFHPLAVDLTNHGGEQSEAYWWRIMNIGSIPGLPHPPTTGMAHEWRIYRYEDALNALPTKLFDTVMGGYRWNITPFHLIKGPYMRAEGLPMETALLNPHADVYYTDISLGFMDKGEELLESPGGDAVFVDLTGNGLPDLVVVGGKTQVYENLGGTFRKVADHGLGDYTWAAVAAGDFNRDGRPDLAIYGRKAGTPSTSIYENLGQLRFGNIGADLIGASASEGIHQGSMAWGDYDNDGLEDLAYWSFGTKELYLYRNQGNGTFERAPFDFPTRWEGGLVAWHDVNANGLLDLTWGSNAFLNQGDGVISAAPVGFGDMMGGFGGSGLWADFTGNGLPDLAKYETFDERIDNILHRRHRVRFLRNQGDGALTQFANVLHDLHYPRMIAADYNNSGQMDLVSSHYTGTTWMGGYSTAIPRATAMFRQLPDGTFHNAGLDLLGTVDGVNTLADVDGDGDLDILTMGQIQVVGGGPAQSGSRLHRGLFAQSPFANQANTPPTPPADLRATHNAGTGETVLMWGHGTDAETPQVGLAYNVRVGSWHNGNNIVSSASCAPVTPGLRYYRIASDQPGLILRDLPPGYYYWSARTVDGGRVASGWAPEQTFSLLDGYIIEDLNQDGVFDAADLVAFGSLVRQHRADLPMRYDFNTDETISQADVRTLANRLLGSTALHPGSHPIGPEGGIIEQDGIEIAVPPGAFPEIAVLNIEMLDPDTTGLVEMYEDYEPQGFLQLFQVTGVPLVTDGPWHITLQPYGPPPEMPLVVLGETSFAFEMPTAAMNYRFEEPEILSDGRYRITVPRLDDVSGLKSSGAENTFTFGLFNLGSVAKYHGPRFAIYFPKTYFGEDIENLMDGFEDAYRILRDEYGFSYARRTRWPVEVYVTKLPLPEMYGTMITTYRGVNYGYIQINTSVLENHELARATACHEFFHVVQGFYDPAWRVTQARRETYPRWWLDEAMSGWAEELVVSNRATYIPGTYRDNVEAPFLGVGSAVHGDGETAMNQGYGMAPLVKYLVDSGRTGAPLAVYEATWAGSDPIEALEAAVTDYPLRIWYDDFFRQLVEGKIYAYENPAQRFVGLAGPARRTRLEPGSLTSWRRFEIKLPDLAAGPYPLFFTTDYPDPPADAFFVIRFEGDPSLGLQFFLIPPDEQAVRVASAFGPTEVKYGTLPNALHYKTNRDQLLTLVSNTNAIAPYTEEREGTLAIGLARPGPFPLDTSTTSAIQHSRYFPAFTGSGSIEAGALSDYKQSPLANGINLAQAAVWARDNAEIIFSYQATIGQTVLTWEQGGRTRTLSTDGIGDYLLHKSDGEGNILESHTSSTGTFTVQTTEADREKGSVTYDLRVTYNLTYQEEGGPPSTTTEEWPLVFSHFVIP